jgi:hypothetical protein
MPMNNLKQNGSPFQDDTKRKVRVDQYRIVSLKYASFARLAGSSTLSIHSGIPKWTTSTLWVDRRQNEDNQRDKHTVLRAAETATGRLGRHGSNQKYRAPVWQRRSLGVESRSWNTALSLKHFPFITVSKSFNHFYFHLVCQGLQTVCKWFISTWIVVKNRNSIPLSRLHEHLGTLRGQQMIKFLYRCSERSNLDRCE